MVREFTAGNYPFNEEECGSLNGLDSRLSSPEALSMGEEALAEITQFAKVVEEIWATQTIESVEKLVDLTESVEARTCRINTQNFSQTFKETSPGNWSNVAEPGGQCGVVRLDRFRRVEPARGLTVWNYFSESGSRRRTASEMTR